jgi:hypothetical protein
MIEITLTQGKVAIIDNGDLPLVSQYKWHAQKSRDGRVYAKTTLPRAHREERAKRLSMHRLIMGAPEGVLVDHRNGDTLDNRRSNLRLATNKQNNRNIRPHSDSDSPYKGVTYVKRSACWISKIGDGGKIYHLGYYDDPIEAARAYDQKARELFGEFANLNFPESNERPKGKRAKSPATSYRGVAFVSTRNIWTARIKHEGKRIFLGNFHSAEDAARAYDAKAREIFGDAAKLNFPA